MKQRAEIYRQIRDMAQQMAPQLVDIRRDFHKYAEGRWMEMRTSSLIARYLQEMGYEVLTGEAVCKRETRMGVPSAPELEKAYQRALEQGGDPAFLKDMKDGMTGVIGILRCGQGPVMALRFDIDALAITESDDPAHPPVREGFASVNAGYMHACGHDFHAALGLGTAKILMAIKEHLHGTVKLIFQPCEEGVAGGARSIVAKGHLDDVMYMVGGHMTGRTEQEPDIAVIPGSHGWLATAKYAVHYRGLSSHAGSAPEKGKDALLAAVTAIKALYSIPRTSQGATRVGVGRVFDESAVNVVSSDVRFCFEVRGSSNESLAYMQEKALRIIRGTADMYEIGCEIEQEGEALAFDSEQRMRARIRRVAAKDLHLKVSRMESLGNGGSEDVGYMILKTIENGGEAAFMRIMSDVTGAFHRKDLNISESCLPDAVSIYAGLVYDICGEKQFQ